MTLRQQVTILEQRGRDDGQQISDLQEEVFAFYYGAYMHSH